MKIIDCLISITNLPEINLIILQDASSKLPSDKPVTRRDAEGVIGAELRNDPNLCTRPGGVAASVAAAARLNQTNSALTSHNKPN